MPRRLSALPGLLLVSMALACGGLGAPPAPPAPPAPIEPGPLLQPAQKPPAAKLQDSVTVVTAKQLAEDFAADWMEAFQRYLRTKVQIEGAVSQLRTVEKDNVVGVVFTVPVTNKNKPEAKVFKIYCNFSNVPQAERDKLATVKVGQTVAVRGNLTGPGESHAIFNFCVLVGKDDPPAGK